MRFRFERETGYPIRNKNLFKDKKFKSINASTDFSTTMKSEEKDTMNRTLGAATFRQSKLKSPLKESTHAPFHHFETQLKEYKDTLNVNDGKGKILSVDIPMKKE